MAKRFTDTQIWEDEWFISLKPEHKLFWFYIKDKCDHAGIWKPSAAVFNILNGLAVNLNEFFEIINKDKQRVEIIKDGRWLLIGFLRFHYGESPNENNHFHRGLIRLLKKFDLNLTSTWGQRQDNDTLHIRDKRIKNKDLKSLDLNKNVWFEELWSLYPNKLGKKAAYKHFKASVITTKDFEDIKIAINNYKNSERVRSGESKFIQHGSTWFNNWKDWIEAPVEKRVYGKTKSGEEITDPNIADLMGWK